MFYSFIFTLNVGKCLERGIVITFNITTISNRFHISHFVLSIKIKYSLTVKLQKVPRPENFKGAALPLNVFFYQCETSNYRKCHPSTVCVFLFFFNAVK